MVASRVTVESGPLNDSRPAESNDPSLGCTHRCRRSIWKESCHVGLRIADHISGLGAQRAQKGDDQWKSGQLHGFEFIAATQRKQKGNMINLARNRGCP